MIIEERKIGKELLYYRALSRRMHLNKEAQKRLEIHERGYEGEVTYDKVYDGVLNHLYVFRGVYLRVEDSTLQCDSLIISDNGFIVHEIKNYSGNYKYEGEKWFVRNFEISEDPLIQLKRTMTKLIKLKYANNLNFTIEGKIVFPNIDFSLSSAHDNIWDFTVMRNQLKRHLSSLKNYPVTHHAVELVEAIQSHIVEDTFFDKVADFDQLKKGVYCRSCGSFDVAKSNVHFKCNVCSHQDTIHTVILSAIAELNALFYNQPITRSKVWDILGRQVGRTTIINVLKKYCEVNGSGSNTTYRFKYYDFDEAYKSEVRLWRYKDSTIKSLN